MKRHVVKGLSLGEISSVDRPAQTGALSVLMKRADDPELALIKASFKEALDGRLIDQNVQKAFYQAFDNLWTGQDAFRKALSDELRAGGDGSTASDAYKDWIGDLIDKAVSGAKDAGAGSKAEANLVKSFTSTLSKAAEAGSPNQEHTMTIRNKAELKKAVEAALAKGDALTTGEVSIIQKAATDLDAEDELPATGPLSKGAGKSKDDMDEDTKKKVKRMVKRDELPSDLRKHYDALNTDAERDAFLAKSADEQKTELAKGLGDDPVVYTTLDGVDIRKSAGDTTLALAKRLDEQSRELAKSQARTEDVELTKRANDDLGNIGGDLVGKKALLKALDTITDAATKDAAEKVLKAANAAAGKAFRKAGSSEGDATETPEGQSEAEAKLDDLAKDYAQKNEVTFEKAYSVVIQTTEGAELYKRSLNE